MNGNTSITFMNWVGNALIAKSFHAILIAIAISLGLLLWNRKQPLLSWSGKRFCSFFFFSWAFIQILSGFYINGSRALGKVGIVDYLGGLVHPYVFNLETFAKWYQHPPFSVFYQNSSHFEIFQILHAVFYSITSPIILSLFLSLGLALWNGKIPFKKFSPRILLSIFFFLIAGNLLFSQINSFFMKRTYLALESYNQIESQSNHQKSDSTE